MRSAIRGKPGAALALAVAALALTLSAPAVGAASAVTGPKQHYLALGDSLAFGFQPDGDFAHGYVSDLFAVLQGKGRKT
jgi:hypothetical protein